MPEINEFLLPLNEYPKYFHYISDLSPIMCKKMIKINAHLQGRWRKEQLTASTGIITELSALRKYV